MLKLIADEQSITAIENVLATWAPIAVFPNEAVIVILVDANAVDVTNVIAPVLGLMVTPA